MDGDDDDDDEQIVECHMCGGDPEATLSNPDTLLDFSYLPSIPDFMGPTNCSEILYFLANGVANKSACDLILSSPNVVPKLQKPCGCSTLSVFTSMPSPFTVPIPASVPGSSSSSSPSIISTGAAVGVVIGVILILSIGLFVVRNNAKKRQSGIGTTATTIKDKTTTNTSSKNNDTTTAVVSTVTTIKSMKNEIVKSQNERVPITLMDTTNKSSLFVLPNVLTTTHVTLQQQLSDDNDYMSGITDDVTSNASGYTVPTTGRTTLSSRSDIDNIPIVTGSIVSGSTTSGGKYTTTLLGGYRTYDDENYNNRDDEEDTLFSKTDASEF